MRSKAPSWDYISKSRIWDCNSVPPYVLKETNVSKLSVILHIIFLQISLEIAIDKRSHFLRWLINFLYYAIFTRYLKENLRRHVGWTALSLKLQLRYAGLFTQLPSSFSLRSCARRNLIYFVERSRQNFPYASPILCLVFEKVLALAPRSAHTYTKFVVAQALLSREDARAYFVGSGPRHYFEIHEVE